MVMSDALKSTYRGVSDGTLRVIDLFFEVFPEDSLRVYLDGEEQTEGFTFDRNSTPQRVTFDEPIPEGVNVIIRRNSDLSELPHVFHYTGNIKGGAEFNAKNMDENFAKILRASEDAMDSFELVGINVEAALDADESANRAREAADDAEESYQKTLAYDLQAKQYRDAAKQYSEDSEASAVVAGAHAQDANTARNGAEAAKAAAEQARDTAQTHRDDALGFRNEAEQFRNSADSSRQAAAGSASAAQLAEQGADASATAAAGSASSAAQSASAANTSRQQAQNAASSASTARDLAYAWANNPEDQAVENNEYSAYHWAKKAELAAGGGIRTEDSSSIEFSGDGTLGSPLSAEVVGLGSAAGADVVQNTGSSTTDVMSQKAVTDALVTKANVTDLSNAIPRGLISMWSGELNTIPSGWALCDGSNGTPDLRDRFVIAAGGSYAVGSTGDGSIPSHSHGSGSLVTNSGGAHSHTASTGSAGSHSHSGSTNSTGAHTHTIQGRPTGHTPNIYTFTSRDASTNSWNAFNGLQVTSSGAHSHSLSINANGAHTHTVSVASGGAHTHSISGTTAASGSGSEVIAKYYALAYIMKL